MSPWSELGGARARPGAPRKGEGHGDALETIKQWTRERFGLGEGDTIVISEAASTLPGFPARETQVGFWTADGIRHRYRVFKPAVDVIAGDVPPAWMKKALAGEGFECECC